MVGKCNYTPTKCQIPEKESTVHCTALVCSEWESAGNGNRRDRANARSRSGSIRDFWVSKVKDGVR